MASTVTDNASPAVDPAANSASATAAATPAGAAPDSTPLSSSWLIAAAVVAVLSVVAITLALLQPYEVFVISPPRLGFSTAEITAIGEYVAQGGSVLFIGEFGFDGGTIDIVHPSLGTVAADDGAGGGLSSP